MSDNFSLVFNSSSLKHGPKKQRTVQVHYMTCIILQNPFSCLPRRLALGELCLDLWILGGCLEAAHRYEVPGLVERCVQAKILQMLCSCCQQLSKICQLIGNARPLLSFDYFDSIASDDCRALQSGDRGRAVGDGRFDWKQVLQGSACRVQYSC